MAVATGHEEIAAAQPRPHVVRARRLASAARARDPGVNLVLVARELPAALQVFAARARTRPVALDVHVAARGVRARVGRALREAGCRGRGVDLLAADAGALALLAARLAPGTR